MITADQLKDIQDRADALYRYLDIEKKKVEFEEEDLRTQAPDFWEDPERAQEQMKLVKDIKKCFVIFRVINSKNSMPILECFLFEINGVCYWMLAILFILRCALQGLGQSFVPTLAGVMELIMRVAAAIFLVDAFGYIGACMSNPLAWLGACIPLVIAFYITMREFNRTHNVNRNEV